MALNLLYYYKIMLQLLRVGFASFIFYYYGIYGFITIIIALYSFYYIIKVKYNLHTLSSGDYLFVDWKKFTIIHITEFETLDKEKIATDIFNNGIKVFPRLRQKLVFVFVDWFFQDVSLEEAKKQIKFENDIKFKSREDIYNYSKKLSSKGFKTDEIQIEFIIVEKEGGGGVLFINFDHVLTDGTGLVGILCSIAGSKEKIEFRVGWLPWLYSIMWMPYFVPLLLWRHLIYIPSVSYPSAFKSNKEFTGIEKFALSKNYSLEKTRDYYKSLDENFTLNLFILSVISVAMGRYHKSINKYLDNKHYLPVIPVNTKTIPLNIREINLENESSGVLAVVPISDTINKDLMMEIYKEMEKTAKDIRYIYTVKYVNFFCSTITPKFIWDQTIAFTLNALDINISNVPGKKEDIFIGGCKATNIIGIPPLGGNRAFMGVGSFKDFYNISFKCDSSIECEPEKFIQIMEEIMDKCLV